MRGSISTGWYAYSAENKRLSNILSSYGFRSFCFGSRCVVEAPRIKTELFRRAVEKFDIRRIRDVEVTRVINHAIAACEAEKNPDLVSKYEIMAALKAQESLCFSCGLDISCNYKVVLTENIQLLCTICPTPTLAQSTVNP